ncbi:NmrA family NAD(P)-binding protein, partial [Streptomyces sp. NPDC059701]|uniref:NmrA family NAD(P)-binding protein n=1 Tax=Streptomyces sp. NPDC059701 TaxID=3346914 RepID=UPI0036A425AF
MTDEPIVVLAATGGQGGAVTRALVGRGARVRAVVRDPARQAARKLAAAGVEVVTGSLSDADSLTVAMAGVRAVFAYTTPFEAGLEAEVAPGRAVIAAATRAGDPPHGCSSVAGAQQD